MADVLELLRKANPVTAEAARALPLEPLPHLGELRPRRTHLRLVLAVVVPALIVLIAAPAFGIGRSILPFFGAEKAPPKVVLEFDSMSTGAPPGMDPGVIASETRKVGVWRFGSRWHTLWVAPTRRGGFCVMWTHAGGGCDREGTVPVSPIGAMAPVHLAPGESPASPRMMREGIPIWIAGHVSAKYVATAEIRFEDGSTFRPELTWVGPPIDAGFFAYDVPAEHRAIGHRAVSVVGLDADGNRVTEEFLGVGTARPDPLADALMSERHAELELETRHGTATIYTLPTRYEGRCLLLAFEGKEVPLYPCLPKGYGFDNLAGLLFLPTRDDVIVAGAPRLHSVELRFADGDSTVLRPRNGFFLYELPERHLVRGAQVTEWIGRDATGATVLTIPFSKLSDACYGPLPLPPGKHCPFGF